MDESIVFVDPGFARSAPAVWRGNEQVVVESDADVDVALSGWEGDLVVLHGGASLASRVLTMWHLDRRHRGRSVAFALAPVSDELKTLSGGKRLGKYARAIHSKREAGRLQTRPVTTLAVTDSGLSHRRIGFTIAFGQAVEAGEGGLAALAQSSLEALEAHFRWVVDRKPQPPAGFVIVSALEDALGVAMGSQTYRAGASLASLVPQSTTLGRLVARRTGLGAASSFERIHIDGATRYLLDGDVQVIEDPGVIELRAGPTVRFADV